MSLHTVTEGAPTLVGSGPASEELSVAERFARDQALLKHPEPEERKAAVVRLVEAGSSAVYPLLRVVTEDACMEVREAAIWSLFWLSSDLLGESREEYDSISHLLRYGSPKDRYLRVATEALWMTFQGESAAGSAANRLTDIDAPSRRAVLRFLRGMVDNAPLVDPDLKGVLRLMRWHPLSSVRRCCAELSRTLLAQEATPVRTERSAHQEALVRRRTGVETSEDIPVEDLVRTMTSDPDRTVRHLAAVRLFCRAREGAEIPMPVGGIKDREVRYLFVEGMPKLCVHPNLVGSFESLLTGPRARNRQLALRLLVHLRPVLDNHTGAAMDGLIRNAMRDKEREVRRDATAVARVASTDYTQAELAGRLREQLRRHPPQLIPIFIVVQVALFTATTLFLPKEYGFAPHFLNFVFFVSTLIRDRTGEHGITHEECLETLCAMEPLAETAPEKLRDSIPELRKLSGRSELNSEVRAKARELLARVHEASLHELPIAATAPERDPATLPVPATIHDQQVSRP